MGGCGVVGLSAFACADVKKSTILGCFMYLFLDEGEENVNASANVNVSESVRNVAAEKKSVNESVNVNAILNARKIGNARENVENVENVKRKRSVNETVFGERNEKEDENERNARVDTEW